MVLFMVVLAFCVGLPLALYLTSIVVNLVMDRERLDKYRAKLGPGFRWRVCLGALSAVVSTIFIGLTYALVYLRLSQGSSEGVPIILVHGLYHNPSAWLIMRCRLKRAGFGNVYTYGYSSFSLTYFDLVHEMTQKMEQVLAANPGRKLALVGHSLGGLIIRGAMADDRFCGKISVVVTLGSPHKGSELAWIGIGRLARSLHPSSHIFEWLAVQKKVQGVALLSLFAPIDNMVFPVRGLELGEPGWIEECRQPDVSHVGLIYDRGFAARTIKHLKQFA